MHSCYYCKSENSENSIFCKNCGNILKCQNCNTIISENSKFCVNCGTDLHNSNSKSTRAVNKLEFSQKGNSKQFNAEFTDEVGVYFATAFNSLVSGTPLPAKNPFQKNFQLTGGKVNLNGDDNKTTEFPEAEFVELDESIILLKIFKQTDDGKLEIIDNRVKEKSAYDKVKRLTILFLYAKKLSGIDSVGRNELNAFISQEKLRLSDLRQYISKDGKSHISVKDNGNLSILTGGEDYARDILKQVNDQNYSPTKSKGGRKPGKKTTTNTTEKRPNFSKVNTSKNSRPSAIDMCKSLIAEGYFDSKRKLMEILVYCDERKGQKYSKQLMNFSLQKLIRDQILDREKKDGNYEYTKK